ncbi:hypothetical protein PHET_10116 [Paragonimus heterotremus]|uniref:Uncharacterized protein n=1 Tax=Paragonimus heterotremus TaxID=100268 RepID=A0A8J4T1Z4_9TREM|nr:hypothetical protein PHET_10116 [Paragonimus heterotremus]
MIYHVLMSTQSNRHLPLTYPKCNGDMKDGFICKSAATEPQTAQTFQTQFELPALTGRVTRTEPCHQLMKNHRVSKDILKLDPFSVYTQLAIDH